MGLRRRPHRDDSAIALLIALALAAISCSKSEPRRGPAPRARGIGPASASLAQHLPAPNDPTIQTDLPPTAAATEPTPATEIEPEAPTPNEAAEKKPERDFENELVQLMGSPADCLEARAAAAAPNQIDISLSTRVMPSGAVAASEVQASALGPNEIACLRRRLESLHFAAPIEHAPIAVNGSLHLTRAPTPPTPTPAAPDASAAAAQASPDNAAMPLATTTQP